MKKINTPPKGGMEKDAANCPKCGSTETTVVSDRNKWSEEILKEALKLRLLGQPATICKKCGHYFWAKNIQPAHRRNLIEAKNNIERLTWAHIKLKDAPDGYERPEIVPCTCKGDTFLISEENMPGLQKRKNWQGTRKEIFEICIECGGRVRYSYSIRLAKDGFVLWDDRYERILAKTQDASKARAWSNGLYYEYIKLMYERPRYFAKPTNNALKYINKRKNPFPLDEDDVEVDITVGDEHE